MFLLYGFDGVFDVAQSASQVGFDVYAVVVRCTDGGDDGVRVLVFAGRFRFECLFQLLVPCGFGYAGHDFRGAWQGSLRVGDAFEHGCALFLLLLHPFP